MKSYYFYSTKYYLFFKGGHTGEMLKLIQHLPENYTPRIYVLANTDKLSESKVLKLENSKINEKSSKNFRILSLKRSREVHQSWLSSFLSTLIALKQSLVVILETRPDVLLCNGPGTCVPLCLAVFIYNVLFFNFSTKVIFIESICRAKTLSLTGRLLYFFVDGFVVQWPELTDKYPNTAYLGSIL